METQPWGAARRAARQIIDYLRILRGAGPAPPTVIHNKKNLAEGQPDTTVTIFWDSFLIKV